MPNAGVPEIIHERTVYPNNPIYFARKIKEIKKLGVSIIGGCCGTNPSYISKLKETIDSKPEDTGKIIRYEKKIDIEENIIKILLRKRLKKENLLLLLNYRYQ